MNCQELIEFLRAYDDGELPAEVKQTFEAHLKHCPPCADYLSEYRRMIDLCRGSVPCCEEVKPEPVPEQLVQAVLNAKKSGTPQTDA